MKSLDLSVVVPVFNENESIPELYEKIKQVASREKLTWELIFVDDGSIDGTDRVILELTKKDAKVKLIQFRKNYGKAAALSAGFKKVCGQYVITMDGDLQDDPEEIPNLIAKLKEGYDLVSGWKKKRKDPITKTWPSKVYNLFTSIFSGIRLHDFNCGLKAYRLDVIQTMTVYGEMHRYLPVIAFQNGFRVTEIPVKHHPRKHGESKFGAERMLRGAFDLMTITFLMRYKKSPLHFFGSYGLLFSVSGLIILVILAVQKLAYGQHLSNRPLLFLGVLLVIVGIQFISLGLIGEMITESRVDRDVYLVRNQVGWDDAE